ncbi:MAG: DUF5666 domain-containing protein [Candidatus Acidiferrales bacterium]
MNTAPSSTQPNSSDQRSSILLALVTVAAAGFTMSCGGGNTTQKFSGNTNVTLIASVAANDQLTFFGMQIQSLTLTNQDGGTVNLLPGQPSEEFVHLNGGIEPLAAITVPQGIYTSATATVGTAEFTCVVLTPGGGLDISTFAYGQTPVANVSVNLASPLSITGSSMALSLNLQASQSASYSSCYVANGIATFAITPTFTLSPATLSAQATNASNGKAMGIDGQVSSINAGANSFVLTFPIEEATRTVNVVAGAGTVFQGINSFAGLTVGTLVTMDGVVQTDGSLSATRIAVEDPGATSVETGPVLFVSNAIPEFEMTVQQEQGILLAGGGAPFSDGNATFQISGQFTNLNSLPFTPMFNAADMVAGQDVYISTTATTTSPAPVYTPASTVTLMPQTIDGTISGTSTVGSFSVYTVSLASYDLISALAVQAGQTTLLNNPSEVEVYVDGSTQMLSSQAPAAGGTFRFYGLVFNDHGTLRMDCAQVNDGVSVTPAAMAAMKGAVTGRVKVISASTAGPSRQTSFRITPAK